MNRAARSGFAATLFCVFLVALTGTARSADPADSRLSLLSEGLHWPHVSSLISYAGKLWFANSRKYVNHNSADIWSYDPGTGQTRYERHLFSQDAGDPVVHKGLLYWPFEDARFSPGRGEFAVTNGHDWKWGLLPEGQAFHVHAMTSSGGTLFAAPSAWKALLQASPDGGTNWNVVYEHPTPDRRVSRITALADLNGVLYGGLVAWYRSTGGKLIRWDGQTFRQVPGWPEGSAVPRLLPYRGWLYGQNIADEKSSLWRTDGTRVEQVTAMAGRTVRGFAASAEAMWLVSNSAGDGELWRSVDGNDWSLFQNFPKISLHGVGVHDGKVFVGGEKQGRGVLFGPAAGTIAHAKKPGSSNPLPSLPRARPRPAEDPGKYLDILKAALADPSGYDRSLRLRFGPLALSDDPSIGAALGDILRGPFPDVDATMFGSRTFPGPKMARWYILWAMAHNGHGSVPPALITAPWGAETNGAEKYLESPPAAAWAVAELGQDGPATLAALIARLDATGDPDWLVGDMVGALTVLTEQRFAYDIAAWKRWWAARSKPESTGAGR